MRRPWSGSKHGSGCVISSRFFTTPFTPTPLRPDLEAPAYTMGKKKTIPESALSLPKPFFDYPPLQRVLPGGEITGPGRNVCQVAVADAAGKTWYPWHYFHGADHEDQCLALFLTYHENSRVFDKGKAGKYPKETGGRITWKVTHLSSASAVVRRVLAAQHKDEVGQDIRIEGLVHDLGTASIPSDRFETGRKRWMDYWNSHIRNQFTGLLNAAAEAVKSGALSVSLSRIRDCLFGLTLCAD